MKQDAIRASFCIATDATRVLVQPVRTHEKVRQPCRRGHFCDKAVQARWLGQRGLAARITEPPFRAVAVTAERWTNLSGKADQFGKIKIDLQSGDYMLTGDLDVKLCTAAK
jgi:hypothetical protein